MSTPSLGEIRDVLDWHNRSSSIILNFIILIVSTPHQFLSLSMIFSLKPIAYWHQWQVGFSLSLTLLLFGFALGWTSPYLAQLGAPDISHPLKLTPSEVSWVSSLLSLGKVCGNVLGVTIQDFIGRKKTLLYTGVPFAFGWTLIIFATSVQWLYASRLLFGISGGMAYSTLVLFLAEITDPKIRGTVIVLNMTVALIGVSVGNVMGTFLTMEIFSYVSLAVTGLFIALFAFASESPYYYIANSNTKKAEESLQWYNSKADVQTELHELQEFVGSTKVSFARRLHEFKKLDHRRNLIIMCCLHLLMCCAGEYVIPDYLEIIITKSKASGKPSTVAIALSSCNVVVGFIAAIFVDRFGRKPLLIVSSLGTCIAYVLLGSHFHLLSININPASIGWLPVFALVLLYCSDSFGLSVVPHALLGELFPPMIKSLAPFCFSTTGSVAQFAVSQSFLPYIDLVGERFVFWTFAVSALSCAVLTYFCIPETKRMKLVDIQEKSLSCGHPKNNQGNE